MSKNEFIVQKVTSKPNMRKMPVVLEEISVAPDGSRVVDEKTIGWEVMPGIITTKVKLIAAGGVEEEFLKSLQAAKSVKITILE